MGRRKKQHLDDGAGSSDEDGGSDDGFRMHGVSQADLDDEAMMFKDPSRKKRRFTKESAIYGVWADDSDEEDRRRPSSRKGRNLQGGISFVKGDAKKDEDSDAEDSSDGGLEPDVALDEDDDEADGMSEDEESEEEPQKRVPRNRDEEEDEDEIGKSRPGGLGLGSFSQNASATSFMAGLGAKPSPQMASVAKEMPTAFISTKQSRPGIGQPAPAAQPPPKVAPAAAPSKKPTIPTRVDKDFAKFEKFNKGIGLKYLQKMGYVPGQGLGKDGRGISQPIDVKVRPQKMGLGHKGFDERTETVKRDQQNQKSRYVLSDEEEEKAAEKAKEKEKDEVWRKGTKKPKKPKYKTATEVIQEQTLMMAGQTIDGITISTSVVKDKIIDMTGKQARELTDMSEASYQAALRDSTSHLVELRHNIRMLVSECELNLVQLTRNLTLEKAKRANAEEAKIAAAKARDSAGGKIKRLGEI
ncbi:hypothetical protein HDU67_002117, partial [Dinochytrium kinnereticum]